MRPARPINQTGLTLSLEATPPAVCGSAADSHLGRHMSCGTARSDPFTQDPTSLRTRGAIVTPLARQLLVIALQMPSDAHRRWVRANEAPGQGRKGPQKRA